MNEHTHQRTATYRIALVGAGSLRGKQLNEALAESSFADSEILLLDDDEVLGKLESVGDEVTFIQHISADSFERADFAFFAGHGDATRRHWQKALHSGASILDLSSALEGEKGVLVRGPWAHHQKEQLLAASAVGLQTPAVVSAHPAAVVLALLLERIQALGAIRSASATVFEPASEYGREALDELHQQTVALLSFQSIPKHVYDIQAAFNAIGAAGDEAKINLSESESRIRRHYALLSAGHLPSLSLQLIHVPVFHGHDFSIAVECEEPVTMEQVEASLSGPHVEVILGDADGPSNLTSAGQNDVLVRIRFDDSSSVRSRRFWLWAASDNLAVAVSNAIECAQELRKLRPRGTVQ